MLPVHCVGPNLSQSQAKTYAGQFMLFKVPGTLKIIFYETHPSFSSLIEVFVTQISFKCEVQLLKLLKLPVPPHLNTDLVINLL